MGEPIVIYIDEDDRRPTDPCLRGGHVWAWAWLVSGDAAQKCRRCGRER